MLILCLMRRTGRIGEVCLFLGNRNYLAEGNGEISIFLPSLPPHVVFFLKRTARLQMKLILCAGDWRESGTVGFVLLQMPGKHLPNVLPLLAFSNEGKGEQRCGWR